jgi:hypothetical protein
MPDVLPFSKINPNIPLFLALPRQFINETVPAVTNVNTLYSHTDINLNNNKINESNSFLSSELKKSERILETEKLSNKDKNPIVMTGETSSVEFFQGLKLNEVSNYNDTKNCSMRNESHEKKFINDDKNKSVDKSVNSIDQDQETESIIHGVNSLPNNNDEKNFLPQSSLFSIDMSMNDQVIILPSDESIHSNKSSGSSKYEKHIGKAQKSQILNSMTIMDLRPHFHLSLKEASEKLGICTTVLKRVCRNNSIEKWPFRKIRSLKTKLESLNQLLADSRSSLSESAIKSCESQITLVEENISKIMQVL